MKIIMSGSEARLEGACTLAEVTRNLYSLSRSLQQLDIGNEKPLRVDCGQIKETDICGLQLLNVWMQCVRFRGIEPTLVNVPESLRHAMQFLVGHGTMETLPH